MSTGVQGPMPGKSQPDADDLSGNGDNPHTYSHGDMLPHDIDERPSAYPTLQGIAGAPDNPSVIGYYFNPKPDPINPFHDGEGAQTGVGGYSPTEAQYGREIASGVDDNVQQQVQDWLVGITAPDPVPGDQYQHDIRVDTAQDEWLIPIDDRK